MRGSGLFSLACVIAMSLAFTACDSTAGNDGGVRDGLVYHDGLAPDQGTQPAAYKFVKIEDLSTIASQYQDGADIDAVELQKAGGASSWASTTVSCKLPAGTDCANPDKATGASDAFCTDATKCFSNVEDPTDDPSTVPPYTSLGGNSEGTSGTIILEMADKIANGDKLIVYEVGNCDVSESCEVASTTQATAESVKVSVGTSATGPWVEVLAASDTANHPDIEITVSGLQ